jgi:hypothetical protein
MRISIPVLFVAMATLLLQLPAPAYSQRFLVGVNVAAQMTDSRDLPIRFNNFKVKTDQICHTRGYCPAARALNCDSR